MTSSGSREECLQTGPSYATPQRRWLLVWILTLPSLDALIVCALLQYGPLHAQAMHRLAPGGTGPGPGRRPLPRAARWYAGLCGGVLGSIALGGIVLLPLVDLVWTGNRGGTPRLDTVLRLVYLGLMSVLTLTPMWLFRGVLRLVLALQGLLVTLGACLWPIATIQAHPLWWLLGYVLCVEGLFASVASWQRHVRRPPPRPAQRA